MDVKEIITFIQDAEKKAPVKVYLKEKRPVALPDCKVFGIDSRAIFGDWKVTEPILKENAEGIGDMIVEGGYRNSVMPLLDKRHVDARIEPGTVIRDRMETSDNAVITMSAIIDIGAVIGEGTMIDMGAVLGDRATAGRHCHIDARAVLAGVIEPASATPVIMKGDVLIGANAIVIKGMHIGKSAVVAADAMVIEGAPASNVVIGCPAYVIKEKDVKTTEKAELVDVLCGL